MKTLHFALRQIIPLLFSYLFVGIAFGVLAVQAGYSTLWAGAAGLFVYAGSMQIVMISLLLAGTPLVLVGVMTFFVNARMLFYGLGFIERFRKAGWRCPYLALTLTDETYSILCSVTYPEEVDGMRADGIIGFSCHLLWVCSCVAGALLGQALPVDLTGIDFSATALFVTVVVNQWRQFGSHLPAIAGLMSALLFRFLLGADTFILPALSVSLIVLLVLRDRINLQMRGGQAGE